MLTGKLLAQVSEPVKTALDGVAVMAWVTALLGVLTNVFGLIAAIGSAVWIWLRVYDWYENRGKGPKS
jgi:hypothetical protein